METILIKFYYPLVRHELQTHPLHHGPLFYRWLPDATNDAITINEPEENYEISFWFKKYGKTQGNFIKFSYKDVLDDTAEIQRQALLDGGPLFGLAKFHKIEEKLVNVIKSNELDSILYKNFAKSTSKTIYKISSRFINLLRSKYGQYWISPVDEWDNRSTSLASYCNSFCMRWSIDGVAWENFYSKLMVIELHTPLLSDKDAQEAVTREDWCEIKKTLKDHRHSLESEWLARAHEYFRRDQIRHAFIEGVTALEMALEKYYKRILEKSPKAEKRFQDLWGRPLQTKIAILLLNPRFNEATLTLALEAIEIRNQIIHDGYEPSASQALACEHLLRLIGQIIFNDTIKLPKGNGANRVDTGPACTSSI